MARTSRGLLGSRGSRRTLRRASLVVGTRGKRVMQFTGHSITVHRTPSTGVLLRLLSSSRKPGHIAIPCEINCPKRVRQSYRIGCRLPRRWIAKARASLQVTCATSRVIYRRFSRITRRQPSSLLATCARTDRNPSCRKTDSVSSGPGRRVHATRVVEVWK